MSESVLEKHWNTRWFNYGMTRTEIHEMLRELEIHHKTFWKAFGVGNTCMYDEASKQGIYYYCDIEKALATILKYRNVYLAEMD